MASDTEDGAAGRALQNRKGSWKDPMLFARSLAGLLGFATALAPVDDLSMEE